MTNSSSPNPILTFDGKKYNINNLSDEVKEKVKGLQIADSQLRLYEDTLKIIAIGRQSIAKELHERLKGEIPITDS